MRYWLVTIGLVAAMVALFAGAFGDFSSWRQDWPGLAARMTDAPRVAVAWLTGATQDDIPPVPAPGREISADPAATRDGMGGGTAERHQGATASSPAPVPTPASASDLDPVRHQIQDLHARISQESDDLTALRATAEQTRQELAALREQRLREQAELDQANRLRRAMADVAAASPPRADRPAEPPDDQTPPRPAARVTASPPAAANEAKPPRQASLPPRPVPDAADEPAAKPSPDAQRLIEARAALVAGRGDQARRLLSLARAQMTARSASAGAPDATTASQPATQVGYAIGMLNRGDSEGALRAIDLALTATDGTMRDAARRNYRTPPDQGAR